MLQGLEYSKLHKTGLCCSLFFHVATQNSIKMQKKIKSVTQQEITSMLDNLYSTLTLLRIYHQYCWNNLSDSNCTTFIVCVIDRSLGNGCDLKMPHICTYFAANGLVYIHGFVFKSTCIVRQAFGAITHTLYI